MKRSYLSLSLMAALLCLAATPVAAQDWVTYESEEFDLQFDLPDDWETEVDGETLTATGDGIVFVLAAVKDETISTHELFDIQVETLDMDAEGEYEEIELNGGMLGVMGTGVVTVDGEEMGIILLAATLDENNYVAYIIVAEDAFDEHEDTMVDILTSIAPLGWVDG